MPVNACCCKPLPTCIACGSCCYSSDCHVTFAWSLKDTPFAPGDESFTNMTGTDLTDALVALNSVRTGSAYLPMADTCLFGADDFDGYTSETGLNTGNAIWVAPNWAWPNWHQRGGLLFSSIPPSIYFTTVSVSGLPSTSAGGCCGIPANTPVTFSQVVMENAATQKVLVYSNWSVKISITVTGNKCCYSASASGCEYTGSENCSTSASTGRCLDAP